MTETRANGAAAAAVKALKKSGYPTAETVAAHRQRKAEAALVARTNSGIAGSIDQVRLARDRDERDFRTD